MAIERMEREQKKDLESESHKARIDTFGRDQQSGRGHSLAFVMMPMHCSIAPLHSVILLVATLTSKWAALWSKVQM